MGLELPVPSQVDGALADQRLLPANRQGAQGAYDSAPKGQLENEFGTSNEDDVIKAILEKGSVQESTVSHHRHLFPPLTGAHLAVLNSSHRKQQCADQILSSQRCPSDRDPRTTPRAPWLLTEPLSRLERYPLTSRTLLI